MNTVIKSLRKELREWKLQLKAATAKYKAYRPAYGWRYKKIADKAAKVVAEYENAIEVLKISSKVHVSGSLPKKDFKVRGTITYDMKKGTSKYKAKR